MDLLQFLINILSAGIATGTPILFAMLGEILADARCGRISSRG